MKNPVQSISSKRQASVLLMVIVFLVILFIVAAGLLTSSVETSRQTHFSLIGYQTQCLAEAAMQRAVARIKAEVNDLTLLHPNQGKADSLAALLRFPLKTDPKSKARTGKLGVDAPLAWPDHKPQEIVWNRKKLARKGIRIDELAEMVDFMTENKAKAWDVSIHIAPRQMYRIGPAKGDEDALVPGVEFGWTLREDVKRFLENKNEGYVSFFLKLPPSLQLFTFKIPVEIGAFGLKVKLFDLNVVTLLDKLLQTLDFAGVLKKRMESYMPGITRDGYLKPLLTFDVLARLVFNKWLYPPGKGDRPIYPLTITLDHFPFPITIVLMWPKGSKVPHPKGKAAYTYHLEKYGELAVTCEASITMPDGHVTRRRIEAVREFRVADIEPPAPMYSFFIENSANAFLAFNHKGGEFFVNKWDPLESTCRHASLSIL